jgi:hypothetical protein
VPVTHLTGLTVVPLRLHPGGGVLLSLGKQDASARVDDAAAATALLKHYLRIVTDATDQVLASAGPGPGQAVRRRLLVSKITAVEIAEGPRGAVRYARRGAAIAELAPPQPTLAIPRAPKPPAIDADLAEWPADGWTPIPPTRTVVGEASAPDDLAPRFQLAWDDAALYLACRVADDKVVARKGARELWRGDCAEVFLDLLLDHRVSGPAYGPDDYQLFLSPAGGQAVSHPLPLRPRPRFAARPVASGWALELALSWNELGIERPEAGYTFGFDLAIDDADAAPERRERQLIWHGRADNYRSTAGFAAVRLR